MSYSESRYPAEEQSARQSKRRKIIIVAVVVVAIAFIIWWIAHGRTAEVPFEDVTGDDPVLAEPKPETFPTVEIAEPVGWPKGKTPKAPAGMQVSRFAEGLEHPRVIYTMPNGDVLVALTRAPAASDQGGITGFFARYFMNKAGAGGASPNQIVLLRDSTGDGRADIRSVLLKDLDSPSGIAWADGTLYIANHDALLAFPYEPGTSEITAEPKRLADLPPAGSHWMRNIIHTDAVPEGSNEDSPDPRIFIAVGSDSNIGEKGMAAEENRAAILEYDIKRGQLRPYAAGLRNPNGLAFNPMSGELWTTVNERDMLGSDLAPDYLTNVPIGAQYGWPWVYWKSNFDHRVDAERPRFLIEYTRRPEMSLGPHVAPLGVVFAAGGHRLGKEWTRGAFVAQHGSWNRRPPSGYDVVFVPFDERGNPTGKPKPVLTGFLHGDGSTYGRPTWLAWANDGALLVSDDTAGIIWRVINPKAEPAADIPVYQAESLPPLRSLDGLKAKFGEYYRQDEPDSE